MARYTEEEKNITQELVDATKELADLDDELSDGLSKRLGLGKQLKFISDEILDVDKSKLKTSKDIARAQIVELRILSDIRKRTANIARGFRDIKVHAIAVGKSFKKEHRFSISRICDRGSSFVPKS